MKTGNVTSRAELHGQRRDEKADHDHGRRACPKADMHGEIVGAGLANRGRCMF
jgi:hypothetical protein